MLSWISVPTVKLVRSKHCCIHTRERACAVSTLSKRTVHAVTYLGCTWTSAEGSAGTLADMDGWRSLRHAYHSGPMRTRVCWKYEPSFSGVCQYILWRSHVQSRSHSHVFCKLCLGDLTHVCARTHANKHTIWCGDGVVGCRKSGLRTVCLDWICWQHWFVVITIKCLTFGSCFTCLHSAACSPQLYLFYYE